MKRAATNLTSVSSEWAAKDVEGSYRGVRAAHESCCGESARWGKRGSVAFGMTEEDDQDDNRNRNRDGNKYNNGRR